MQRAEILDKLNAGDPGGAVTMLRRLMDVNPEDADLLGLLGLALEESGDVSGAEAALRRASALPSATAIRLRNGANLAHLLFDAGRRAEAAALLREGWLWPHDRAPEPNERKAIASLAQAMLNLGLHDETVALLAPVSEVAALHWPLLGPLASALAHTGMTAKALTLLATHQPDDAVPHERAALRAYLLHETGEVAEAVQERDAYVASVPPVIIPAQVGQRLVVGVIDKPPSNAKLLSPWPQAYFTDNYPPQLVHQFSHRYRMAAVFCGAGEEAVDQFNAWQPDVIINNVTNAEYLLTGDNRTQVRDFATRLGAPVINPCEAAATCTRQKNPDTLAGIDGLILPSVRRFRSDLSRFDELIGKIEDGTAYPMIVRTVYDQESQNMTLVRSRAELAAAIRNLNRAQFYVIEFLGQPRECGYFRRMRAAFVDGKPILIRADYAPEWIVRSRFIIDLKVYHDHPDLLEKADAIVLNPQAELGDKAMAALEAVGHRIPLDIFGMDFDVDDEGNVIFFEANATMGMMTPAPDPFPYPPEATGRLIEAIDRLLHEVAARERNRDMPTGAPALAAERWCAR